MADLVADNDPWANVIGQLEAVAFLERSLANPVHAYLFVGKEGAGSLRTALIFAGELLVCSANSDVDGAGSNRDGSGDAERIRRLASAGSHPAISVVRRVGASISRDDIREVVRRAEMAPAEGHHQVLILTEFHLVADAAAMLLKTLEEPPPTTTFVILADEVGPELTTIASRCVRVDFPPIARDEIVRQLESEGLNADDAIAGAAISGGDLDVARLLASDPETAQRRQRWAAIPRRLDGSGSAAVAALADILADTDDALSHVDGDFENELQTARELAERYGGTAGAMKDLTDRQKRERRRMRGEIIRAGVAVIVDEYRRAATETQGPAGTDVAGKRFSTAAAASVEWGKVQANNPREDLALLRLFLRLPPL